MVSARVVRNHVVARRMQGWGNEGEVDAGIEWSKGTTLSEKFHIKDTLSAVSAVPCLGFSRRERGEGLGHRINLLSEFADFIFIHLDLPVGS